ncbi:MAG: heavy metal-binding domain-containing protein [Acidimicrobiia bacterium]
MRPLLHALKAARLAREEDPTDRAAVKEWADDTTIVVDFRPPARVGTAVSRSHHTPSEYAEAADSATAALTQAIASRPTTEEEWISVEPEAPGSQLPAEKLAPARPQPAPEWGEQWRDAIQGWVRIGDGAKVWRPIVTTTTTVPNWEIDTNLGIVTGESACAVETKGLGTLVESVDGNDAMRKILARDRALAQEAMVREAVARGAHAVIGVNLDYTFLGECLILTVTGTAVTLRNAQK